MGPGPGGRLPRLITHDPQAGPESASTFIDPVPAAPRGAGVRHARPRAPLEWAGPFLRAEPRR